MVPETRYAKSGDLHIAYQVVGDGPVDLVFVHGWISHIEHLWEEPSLARFLGRLASFSRLILLDKRDMGLSDPVPLDKLPTFEERMDDLRAVMAAAGSERAALLGTSEAGALNLLFSPARAIRCGLAICEAVRRLGVEVRVGVHTGECELVAEKIGGIAVHIGARVAALAQAGEVLVSTTVRDLVAG